MKKILIFQSDVILKPTRVDGYKITLPPMDAEQELNVNSIEDFFLTKDKTNYVELEIVHTTIDSKHNSIIKNIMETHGAKFNLFRVIETSSDGENKYKTCFLQIPDN
jgi:hypothetical protein